MPFTTSSCPLDLTGLPDRASIAAGLHTTGFVITPEFIPMPLVGALRAELWRRALEDRLCPATIGQGQNNQLRTETRGDLISWVDAYSSSSALQQCLTQFEHLRLAINETLFLGLFDFECHFSLYRPDACYARHLDQFRNDNRRRVSCVLYLNHDWGDVDGGALRLYLAEDDSYCDVAPRGGTLVAFLSDRFEHEVLPARRARYSLAGWFKVRC